MEGNVNLKQAGHKQSFPKNIYLKGNEKTMTLFATKGTSLLMTILIWFLSLFGVHIGGGGNTPQPLDEYYFIPEGASLVMEDQTIKGPDKLKTNTNIANGTVYIYEDYTYTKDGNAWNVNVIDKTKTSYKSVVFRTDIVDKDLNVQRTVKNLFGSKTYKLTNCYADCVNLVDAPSVPNGCLDMTGAFRNCTNLVTPPQVEGDPDMSNAFDNCPNIRFPENYKIALPKCYLNYEKSTNSWKFVQQKFTEDDVHTLLARLEATSYKYCGRDIKVNEIKFYDITQSTLTLKPVPGNPRSAYFVIQYKNDIQYESSNDYWYARNSKCCIHDYEVKTKLVKVVDSRTQNYFCTLKLVPDSTVEPEHYVISEQNPDLDSAIILNYLNSKNNTFAGTSIDVSGLA